MSRFALTTWVWIGIGTVVAIVLPFSTIYWSGAIFWGSYLDDFRLRAVSDPDEFLLPGGLPWKDWGDEGGADV